MTTASLELCRELYELSGWEPEQFYIKTLTYRAEDGRRISDEYSTIAGLGNRPHKDHDPMPAYDLGYLMRKLPGRLPVNDGMDEVLLELWKRNGYIARYDFASHNTKFIAEADTPENALCQLAIELFKKGIL